MRGSDFPPGPAGISFRLVHVLVTMLGCVACTTTLDPTLRTSVAGTGTGGGSGASGGGGGGGAGAGSNDSPALVAPLSLTDCALLGAPDRVYRVCNRGRSFAEAAVDCSNASGALIKIDSSDETDLLKTALLPGRQWGWIGASRDDDFEWTWLDGTPFWHGAADGSAEGGAYVNWQPGEPDNSSDTVRNEERCATFDIATAGWVDRYCDLLLPYVCELPAAATATGGM